MGTELVVSVVVTLCVLGAAWWCGVVLAELLCRWIDRRR